MELDIKCYYVLTLYRHGDGRLGVRVGERHPLVHQVAAVLIALHVVQPAQHLHTWPRDPDTCPGHTSPPA